jgi:hypothetical protein
MGRSRRIASGRPIGPAAMKRHARVLVEQRVCPVHPRVPTRVVAADTLASRVTVSALTSQNEALADDS